MTPTYLALVGRTALCYSTSVGIAKQCCELFLFARKAWDEMAQHAAPGMVPFLTILKPVNYEPPKNLTWKDEHNGLSAYYEGAMIRIETIHWGIKDPRPVPRGH